MDIHIGTWIYPALATIALVGIASWASRGGNQAYGYDAIGAGVVSGIIYLVAIIGALITWLAWALTK